MHTSSYEKVDAFVTMFLADHRKEPLAILDVGSQTVARQPLSYASLFDAPAWTYTGLDVEAGLNVDIVPANHYRWDELGADSFDVVVSGQAFEHIPYFWATAFEIGRVLRPGGLAVIIAPGRGPQHRYPVDCWRFHDDGFQALADYLDFEVLDVFTEWGRNMWEESILVMRKPVWSAEDRQRFTTRLGHQRALSTISAIPADGTAEPSMPTESEPPPPSPLRDAVGGPYTERLEQLRVQGIELRSRRNEAALRRWVRVIPRRVRRKIVNLLVPPRPIWSDEDAA
jgi:SAM-dependent methyltransferase